MSVTDPSLIYIHGFNSSPQSMKAQLLLRYFEQHQAADRIHVPALPPSPKEAMALLEQLIARSGPVALLGSSLGGFYATWLAQHHGLQAVLVNPAVQPSQLLRQYIGQNANYHTGEEYEFEPQWVDQLKAYELDEIRYPENLLVLLQTADETLNWQDAWDYYADCHLYRGLGGSHGFEDFDTFIPLVLRFCGINL